MVSATENK